MSSAHPDGVTWGSSIFTICVSVLFLERLREYGSVTVFFSIRPVEGM